MKRFIRAISTIAVLIMIGLNLAMAAYIVVKGFNITDQLIGAFFVLMLTASTHQLLSLLSEEFK